MLAHIALVGSRVTTSLYALSLHASQFSIGILIALFSLFPMLFAVQVGRLIDRVGIARPMIFGALFMGLGCTIPSLLDGLSVLYFAVPLIGLGFLAIHVSVQHAVGTLSTKETRASYFSQMAVAYSTSSFSGPVIVGFVIDHARHSIAYTVLGGFVSLTMLLILFGRLDRFKLVLRIREHSSESIFDLLRDREMRPIYMISVLLGSAWDLFNFVMPIHGSQLGFSASTIGLILGGFSASTFAVRLAMGWISRRYSEWHVLTTALAMAVICFGLFPFMEHLASIMVVTVVLGFALGSSQPNVLALLHHASPEGRAGEAVGIRVTMSNACQVAMPLAFGAAGATLGLFAVFWGMGAMLGTGVPLAWRKASAELQKN